MATVHRCVVLFATLHLLGLDPSIDSIGGLVTFFVLPLSVCWLVLYFTYRAVSIGPIGEKRTLRKNEPPSTVLPKGNWRLTRVLDGWGRSWFW
jgi:hypothetical protein